MKNLNWPDDFVNKIICADCNAILPMIPDEQIGLVATDPPYNIGFTRYSDYRDDLDDEDYINMIAELKRFPTAIIHYPEEMMSLIVPALGKPEEVMAWCYNQNMPRQFRLINFYNCQPDFNKIKIPYKNPDDKRVQTLITNGSRGVPIYDWFSDIEIVRNVSKEKTEHPCPVPVDLMKRIISLTTEPNDIVLDPFSGSGSSLVAAKQLGRRFIGIEISPKYCRIAEDRLRQEQLAL